MCGIVRKNLEGPCYGNPLLEKKQSYRKKIVEKCKKKFLSKEADSPEFELKNKECSPHYPMYGALLRRKAVTLCNPKSQEEIEQIWELLIKFINILSLQVPLNPVTRFFMGYWRKVWPQSWGQRIFKKVTENRYFRTWQIMPAMLGCNTTCPKCKHEFTCCPPACCKDRRSLHPLHPGGTLATALTAPTSPCLSPQVSPSAPLAFILPPFPVPLYPLKPLDSKPETELERLADCVQALRLSGWYYEGISYQTSDELLKNTELGTFLVRNSADPRYLFSLSVQTERGPTSVRLCYLNGYFRLDARTHLQLSTPLFSSVVELVEHYVKQSQLCQNKTLVLVDPQHGKFYSTIKLAKPLRKQKEAPSLKHLSRLAIHKALQSSNRPKVAFVPAPHTELELPKSLKVYLGEYPYSI